MILSLFTNVQGNKARNVLGTTNAEIGKAAQKLSTGLKLNTSADDAAGLAISEKMRAQIRGLNMASKDMQDGLSLLQLTDYALSEISNMVVRVRELAIQASNDSNADADREKMNLEVEQLLSEIDGLAERTEFNTIKTLKEPELTIENGLRSNFSIYDPEVSHGVNMPSSAGLVNSSVDSTSVQTFNIRDPVTSSVVKTISFDLGQYMKKVDPNFNSFLQQMYEPDGSITDKNKDYFLNVFIKALNDGFKDTGAGTTVLGTYDSSGNIVIGLRNGQELAMGGCSPAPSTAIGHGFLHMMFTPSSAKVEMRVYQDKELWFQMGANSLQGKLFSWNTLSVDQMGLRHTDVLTLAGAQQAISNCDDALEYTVNIRATLGSYMNRLGHAISNSENSSENASRSLSFIVDSDMAKEMMEYTKNNVLLNASMAMLTQSNRDPQMILQLLG